MEAETSSSETESSGVARWLVYASMTIAAGFLGKIYGFTGVLVVVVSVFAYYVYQGYSKA